SAVLLTRGGLQVSDAIHRHVHPERCFRLAKGPIGPKLLLVTTVARGVWGWPWHVLLPMAGLFLALDLMFVSANLHKIPDGGWFPLIVGAAALSLILIWRRGAHTSNE